MKNYAVTLSLPGGGRKVLFALDIGEAVTGTMTNPYMPQELLPVAGTAAEGKIRFSTKVGRVDYSFEGTYAPESLDLCLTTKETIVLEPGKRLSGETGQIPGEYLVGVYSPGGVKENHFVIEEENGKLSGEMFGLVTEASMKMMPGPDGPGGPGGPGDPGGPGGPPKPMKVGDKMDVNVFIDGEKTPEGFRLVTKTAQGSLFIFAGAVDGDTISMTMYVTDVTEGLKVLAE